MVRGPGVRVQVVSLFAVLMLAVAQPLFEQLARSAEFFIVRGATTRELAFLILILCLSGPLIALVLITLARLVNEKSANLAHAVLFFLSLCALFLVGFNRVLTVPGWMILLITVAITASVVWGFYKFKSIRHFFIYLAIVVVIVPVLFLRSPSISKIFFARQPLPPRIEVRSQIPIVLVIFDELPLSTLLDGSGKIDAEHFPNFGSLAAQSFCFLNATTVADFTTQAIPAIVTGRYARPNKHPLFADHPQNLFALLGHSYDLLIFESATRLCPNEYVRTPKEQRKIKTEMSSMLMDLAALYLHMIVPSDFGANLPPVNQVWINFWGGGVSNNMPAAADRLKFWNDFVNLIKPSAKPGLYFIHSQFPHSPWVYLPSGEYLQYDAEGAPLLNNFKIAANDSTIKGHRLRRHILQTAFADLLLGGLIERLLQVGLYDKSLVIVTADHGISFRAQTGPRAIRPENFHDIMLVPLFIKVPGQKTGQIIQRNVETIDILPTIGEILQMPTPWAEGQSVLAPTSSERKIKKIFTSATQQTHQFGPRMTPDPLTNSWKLNLIRNDPYFKAQE